MSQTMQIAVAEIKFDDSKRHRKELSEIESIASSIQRIGLLNPIIVDSTGKLLAGRRRVEAYRKLGYETIPARLYESLDPAEQKLVELDENLRRVDISWGERALAILELHELKESPSISATAEYIGLDEGTVSASVLVGKELRKGNAKITACNGLRQAAELLRRQRQIALDTAFSKDPTLGSSIGTPVGAYEYEEEAGGSPAPLTQRIRGELPSFEGNPSSEEPKPIRFMHQIIQADFIDFASNYKGPKFNFIHCDFPYGINFQDSAAAGSAGHESQYEDSAETFWALTTALLKHQETLVLDSAHMVFWFSMNYYQELIDELEAANWFVHPIPLIWHKSDGMGIASDYRRRPKHIYETALWCSRGDRLLSQLRADLFSHPIAKTQEGHLSAKPLAMLEFFLSMGVNEHTDFLDPTCGSGTSIRAARNLGACRALGLELNAETAQSAESKLRAGDSK